MSLDSRADFDEPVHMSFDEPEAPKKSSGKGKKKAAKPKKEGIPTLPAPTKPLTDLEVRRGVTNRDKSVVNLKLAGASYQDIADQLELSSAGEAKRIYERTLAATHGPEDWQTLRMTAAARAEEMFARSLAMAKADFLITEDGERVPNRDKRGWHAEARNDLVNLVQITGAKAPTKIEITPDEARMEEIVAELLSRSGVEDVIEAEVIELTQLPSTELDLRND